MEPVLKWAGGKHQLLPQIKEVICEMGINIESGTYFEPFLGGGALLFDLMPQNAIVNDYNPELINVYKQIRNRPNVLIKELVNHQANNSKEYYYSVRELDRKPNYKNLSKVEKAARIMYLNKTCFNGLYRVNSLGFFNVPYGKNNNPDIVCESRIKNISKYLKRNNVRILCGDFETAVKDAVEGDFVYFDPPYDYEETGFSTYTPGGFSRESLERLHEISNELIERGCAVIISNNDTSFVNTLFSEDYYNIKKVKAFRFINCNGKSRNKVDEVIIYGKK